MRKKLIQVAKLLLLVLCILATKRFCYRKTDGFAFHKILSPFPFHPEWESSAASAVPSEELESIFNQPYTYLARGAQCFVFASQDGRNVIKFFRLCHMRAPKWMTVLTFPLIFERYRLGKILERRRSVEKDFNSYKIAFEEMKEETGLLYIHLNKTDHLKKHLTIYDKIGVVYDVDLDQVEFLVQKKATLVYPTIEKLLKTQGLSSAKQAITRLVQLLKFRCEKGIFDKDPDLNTNFGFLDLCPVQIDIGRFRYDEERSKPSIYRDEIIRITDNLRQWLDTLSPALSDHLLAEIGNIQVEQNI